MVIVDLSVLIVVVFTQVINLQRATHLHTYTHINSYELLISEYVL